MGRQLGDGLMQGRALWQLGRLQGHQGHHEKAATMKLEALKLLERALGKEHLDIAKCCTGVCHTIPHSLSASASRFHQRT